MNFQLLKFLKNSTRLRFCVLLLNCAIFDQHVRLRIDKCAFPFGPVRPVSTVRFQPRGVQAEYWPASIGDLGISIKVWQAVEISDRKLAGRAGRRNKAER